MKKFPTINRRGEIDTNKENGVKLFSVKDNENRVVCWHFVHPDGRTEIFHGNRAEAYVKLGKPMPGVIEKISLTPAQREARRMASRAKRDEECRARAAGSSGKKKDKKAA